MRLVVGLTEWLFSMHTGLIDAYAKDTVAPLLTLPVIRSLRPGETLPQGLRPPSSVSPTVTRS